MSDVASLEVLIQIREELAGLNRTREQLQGAKKDAASLGSILKQGLGIGSGIAIATAGVALLRNTLRATVGDSLRMAGEIKNNSQALGMQAEAYQVIRREMMKAGVDAGRLEMAFQSQTQSLAAARTGAGAAADAFRVLGLSASKLEEMSPERRLEAVTRATLTATDRTRAFQAAGQILGQRGLPQLLNALRRLATEGYDGVAASAKAAGEIMEDETVARLDRAKGRIEEYRNKLTIFSGDAIALADRIMGGVGAGVANMANIAAGRPLGDRLQAPTLPGPVAAPAGPSMADGRDVLAARIANAEAKSSAISSSVLFDETQRRKALLPVLREQEHLYEALIKARFGEAGKGLPANGQVTEEELSLYQQRNELEQKLVMIRQQRMEAVDTPLAALSREMLDTTTLVSQTLQGSLSAGVASLSSNIWGAMSGTNKWRDSWKSLGAIAGQALTELMVKLMIIRPFMSMLGLNVPKGSVSIGEFGSYTPPLQTATAAGGGTFLTNGPTKFTVGDNPGGVELVSVLPISGVGRSTVNGQAIAMAGGGSALVQGAGATRGGGDTFHFSYTFQGGVSRQEVMGMLPQLVEASKSAVLDAKQRHRGGFHR